MVECVVTKGRHHEVGYQEMQSPVRMSIERLEDKLTGECTIIEHAYQMSMHQVDICVPGWSRSSLSSQMPEMKTDARGLAGEKGI